MNRNCFRPTVVKGAPGRITQYGISLLEFEKRVTAKARLIGVKLKRATPKGRCDFFGRCFGRQVKNEIVVLFLYGVVNSTVHCRKSHRGSGG